jgi:hypothetical protein
MIDIELWAVAVGLLLLMGGLCCIVRINYDADDDDNSISDLLIDNNE